MAAKKELGFGLFEVIITCCLLSILMMISIPSYTHWIATHQVDLRAQKLLHSLQFARSYAIMNHCEIVVHPVEHNWSGRIIFETQGRKIIQSLAPDDSIYCEWRGNLGHNNQLVFTSLGATKGQQGSFIIRKNRVSTSVVVYHSGRTRMQTLTAVNEGSKSAKAYISSCH